MHKLYYKERDKILLLCSQKATETGSTEEQVLVSPSKRVKVHSEQEN